MHLNRVTDTDVNFQMTVLGLNGVNGTGAAPHADLALKSALG